MIEKDENKIVTQIVETLKKLDYTDRTAVIKIAEQELGQKLPPSVKGITEQLTAEPPVLDSSELHTKLNDAIRIYSLQLIKGIKKYRETGPELIKEADAAPFKGNFDPGVGGKPHELNHYLTELQKILSEDYIAWDAQAKMLKHVVKDVASNIDDITVLLKTANEINSGIAKYHDPIAKNLDNIYTEYQVEMQSTHTGTPGQKAPNPTRAEAPELYGTDKLTNAGPRPETLSDEQIAKTRAKHRGEFVGSEKQKAIDQTDLQAYELDDLERHFIVDRAANIREIAPQDNKIRSELKAIFTGDGERRTDHSEKMEQVHDMLDRIQQRALSGEHKIPEGEAPAPEAKATFVNRDQLIKAISHEPNYAKDVIETKIVNEPYALIDLALHLQKKISSEIQANGRSAQTQALSDFYRDNIEGNAVNAVVDELHKLQGKKEPMKKCQSFLRELDEKLLRSVYRKLQDNPDKQSKGFSKSTGGTDEKRAKSKSGKKSFFGKKVPLVEIVKTVHAAKEWQLKGEIKQTPRK